MSTIPTTTNSRGQRRRDLWRFVSGPGLGNVGMPPCIVVFGNDKGERSAMRLGILRPDRAAVGFDDMMADGEAEARATGAGFGFLALDELIEHRCKLALGNARSLIGHRGSAELRSPSP